MASSVSVSSIAPSSSEHRQHMSDEELGRSLFDQHLLPLLKQMPGQQQYPGVNLGAPMSTVAWDEIVKACNRYGCRVICETSPKDLFQPAATMRVFAHMHRHCAPGAGDDFPSG